jgi:hypothetical protein
MESKKEFKTQYLVCFRDSQEPLIGVKDIESGNKFIEDCEEVEKLEGFYTPNFYMIKRNIDFKNS